MTGFGVGDAALAGGRVLAEARSVNQRFLEVRAKLPRELADMTLFAEQVARERLKRGRVEITVHTEGAALGGASLDKERAKSAFRSLVELRDEIAPGADVPLSLLAAVPDLFAPPLGREIETTRAALKAAIGRALDAMEGMCAEEGSALAVDLRARCGALQRLVDEVKEASARSRDGLKKRMRERLERLLTSAEITADPSRLEAEVVLLSERSDVTEELIRLASHLDQVASTIDATQAQRTPEGPRETQTQRAAEARPRETQTQRAAEGRSEVQPVGRRLDFLLQEMLREANTLGAKAQDALVSQLAVAIKVELERVREQVQNVE